MSKREMWRPLRETVPAVDTNRQKELGMTSAAWRQAKAVGVRAEADYYAEALINGLKPRHVQQRLAALDPETAATITRRFGDDLADARTRARVFEVCDFVYFEGGDEERLAEHESI